VINMATLIENVNTLNGDIQKIKTTMSNYGVEAVDATTLELADKVVEVFEAGKAQGGGDSYYDTFWDSFQTNGNRNLYNYAFAGQGWNNVTFKPKYPINAVGDASYMFNECALSDFDFVENRVMLNTSGATSLTYCFRSANIKRFGVIDCTSCKEANRIFYGSKVETIDELVVNESLKFTNAFDYTGSLVNITIKGVIAQNGFKITSSRLSKASIESIINALSKTTSGLTVTLPKAAVNKDFETSNDANDGSTSTEWTTLIATRPNWTISLA
jgi:hypothetical protein